MLLYRMISAFIGIPVVLGFMWYGQVPLLILLGLVIALGQRELALIFNKLNIPVSMVLSVGSSLLLLLAAYWHWDLGIIITATVSIILFWTVFRYPKFTPAGAAATIFGLFYIGWMITHLYLIRQLPQGFYFLLLVVVANWTTDSMAYFTGMALGRNKLAPVLSPKKTIEGAIGGIVGSMVCASIFYYLKPLAPLVNYLFLGAGIGILGQLGDLMESALKRQAGVKDSGNIIPGHGGILDRVDSILLTTPLAYYYIKTFIL